jgi:hypothetical protein
MISPFAHLLKSGYSDKLRFHFPVGHEIGDLGGGAIFPLYDLVIGQRPFKAEHLVTAELVKSYGIPFWVDYDDNLLEVPRSNRCFKTYSDRRIQQNISRILKLADVVTVATESLRKLYGVLNENTIAVPNAFDDLHLEHRTKEKKFGSKVVSWRGSATHEEDIHEFLDPIKKAHDKHPEWVWNFFGGAPWFVDKVFRKGSVYIFDPIGRMDYFKFLNSMRYTADIGIVPLKRNNFNEGKSNIAWIEHTYAGSATLAPSYPSWVECEGASFYQDQQTFYEQLCAMMEMTTEERVARSNRGWEKVQETFSLPVVNKQRIEILERLLKTKLRPCK